MNVREGKELAGKKTLYESQQKKQNNQRRSRRSLMCEKEN